MVFSPEIINFSGMLDDPDDRIGVNLLAQLLLREDELGELPAVLQESSDPVVRRRAHWLQHALNMRQRRRRVMESLKTPLHEEDVIRVLIDLHLLWFDKDSPDEIREETEEFIGKIESDLSDSINDLELLMRKLTFLPGNETTIHPESYCIGTVIRQRAGAVSMLCTLFGALLQKFEIIPVRVMGDFGLMDKNGNLLRGCGSWHMTRINPADADFWPLEKLLRYITMTLFSASVNSDSYRYVMSFAQTLNCDESHRVFDKFPYPFISGE